jgi:hypothetical protein
MKKTLIAASVAALVAAPAAFADVTISGQVNVEFSDLDSATNGDTQATQHTDVVLKASEDLGNGMKAGMVYHIVSDDDGEMGVGAANGGVQGGGNKAVFVSGDFGRIDVGSIEPFIENKIMSQMNIDAAEEIDLEDRGSIANEARQNGVIRYTNSMGALSIGLEAAANDGDTDDDFDTTAVYVKYSDGGLTVQAAMEDGAGTNETTAFSVSYKMGDLELRAVSADDDADEMTMVGATYTMGANKFAIGSIVDAAGTNAAADGDYVLSAHHALSKRTGVYISHLSDDAGTDSETVVGMRHKF